MSGNRARRQLTHAPDGVYPAVRTIQRKAYSEEIGAKVIPGRGVVCRAVVLQSPLHFRAVNLTQLIEARILRGHHTRTGKVGDGDSEEQTHDCNPADHDACLE